MRNAAGVKMREVDPLPYFPLGRVPGADSQRFLPQIFQKGDHIAISLCCWLMANLLSVGQIFGGSHRQSKWPMEPSTETCLWPDISLLRSSPPLPWHKRYTCKIRAARSLAKMLKRFSSGADVTCKCSHSVGSRVVSITGKKRTRCSARHRHYGRCD